MNITKSWFYKLSEINASEIIVWDNLAITIFDDINSDLNINIWENSNVEFFWFSEVKNTSNINLISSKIGSKLHFRYLIYSDKNNQNKIKISSEIWSNNCSSDIKILSIAWNNWCIDLDWIIKINSQVSWVKAKLIEENLFLWNKGKIKWIPTLLVESNDVEASHASKIEKISEEELFYLRSRWVGKNNWVRMMIQAKIVDLFKCLSMINKEFYDEIIENILEKIK